MPKRLHQHTDVSNNINIYIFEDTTITDIDGTPRNDISFINGEDGIIVNVGGKSDAVVNENAALRAAVTFA